jgi:hypothetical protein
MTWVPPGRLFVALAHQLANLWIDEMDRATCQAAYAFIEIAGPFRLVIVGSPALHAKAGSRASVQEGWHLTTLAVPVLLALRNVNESAVGLPGPLRGGRRLGANSIVSRISRLGANGLFASATGLFAAGPPTAYADPYVQVGL